MEQDSGRRASIFTRKEPVEPAREPSRPAPAAPVSQGAPRRSVLRRRDLSDPFEPFLAEDLAGMAQALAAGMDLARVDARGMSCLMACAARGLGSSVHFILSRAPDPKALVAQRSAPTAEAPQGLDAFDFAARAGSALCMSLLARELPRAHRASSGKGLMWLAVDAWARQPASADGERPDTAQAWLLELCSSPKSLPLLPDAREALVRAEELAWDGGAALVRGFLGLPQKPAR